MGNRVQRIGLGLLSLGLLGVVACAPDSLSPPAVEVRPNALMEQVQVDEPLDGPALVQDRQADPVSSKPLSPLRGEALKPFFPQSVTPYEQVYSEVSPFLVVAKLMQNGQEVAVLSINERSLSTASVPQASRPKGTFTLAGYPAVQPDAATTTVWVGDRFQVKIQSRSDTFTAQERQVWLQKFDLAGLERLEPAPK